jgi:hypothetical protein
VSIAYALEVEGTLTLSVYNVAGEIVDSQAQASGAGVGVLVWPGTNRSGLRCASGVYLLRVEWDGGAAGFWAKAAIVR